MHHGIEGGHELAGTLSPTNLNLDTLNPNPDCRSHIAASNPELTQQLQLAFGANDRMALRR